jgi:acyl-CoA synthetase (AMP-forming)/AMP-acid ligase II
MAELNFGRLLRRSRLYGDSEALVDLDAGYTATHTEHLLRVERLCAVIAGLGVGPSDRIGVLAGNSHVYIELWHAALDAGQLDARGYLTLADRVKDMIVTGGENVYSIEVENAISSHPAVRQVAVVGVPDSRWGEAVHAVVVCEPDSVTEQELNDHARNSIAGYKVPKGWTLQSDPLPLSAANKVLKRDLRERLK